MICPSKVIFMLIISGVTMLFTGCADYLPRANGPENEIQVFVAQNDLDAAKELLDKILSRVSIDVKQELYYLIKYRDPSQFEQLKSRHNIILFAITGGVDDDGDRLLNQLISKGNLGTYLGDDQVWVMDDLFAVGQVVTIIKGNNINELRSDPKLKGNWLFDQFDARYLERIADHLYDINELTDKTLEIFNHYGWTVRVPHDFLIIEEDRLANFIKLGRDYPLRWFSVHWVENKDEVSLQPNSVRSIIRNLAKRFFDTYHFIETKSRPWVLSQIKVNDREMWRVEGRWEAKSETVTKGGPFISYIFYDNITNQIYHMNMLLFNPGGKKLAFLREMEAMARTFTVDYHKPTQVSLTRKVLIASSIILILVLLSLRSTWKRQKRLTQNKLDKAKKSEF